MGNLYYEPTIVVHDNEAPRSVNPDNQPTDYWPNYFTESHYISLRIQTKQLH